MRTFLPILSTAVVLAFPNVTVRAQDNPAPAPVAAEAPAQTEMQKWIATTDAQWQAVFQRDVNGVRDSELNKVKLQFLTALEEGIKKASKAGDLDGALALRNEQKRFGDTQVFPEKDEDSDTAAVKAIRATIRLQLAKLEKDNAQRAKALHFKYDQVLAQAQAQLTKAERLDDALLVQAKREEVKAAWLAGVPEAPTPAAVAEQRKPELATARPNLPAAKVESGERNLFKNPNFENETNGWELVNFGKKKMGTMAVDRKELHNGKPSLRIDNPEGGDLTFVKQVVAGKPNTHYRLSGYIMTKDIEPEKAGKDWGACLMVGFTAEVYVGQTKSKARGGKSVSIQKTKHWAKITVDFTSGAKTELPVGAAVGYYNEQVTGTAWFSELSLIEVGANAKK